MRDDGDDDGNRSFLISLFCSSDELKQLALSNCAWQIGATKSEVFNKCSGLLIKGRLKKKKAGKCV